MIMKTLFIFFCSVFILQGTSAQRHKVTNFSIGVNGGATYSSVKNYVSDSFRSLTVHGDNYKFCIGYYFGVQMNYSYKQRWTFSIGGNYMLNKVHNNINGLSYLNPDSVAVDATIETRENINTIYLPFTASYNLSKKGNTPFVTVGAAMNVYFSTTLSTTVRQDKDGALLASNKGSFRIAEYHRLIIPLIVGAGYRFSFTKKSEAFVQATYNYSTARLMESSTNLAVNRKLNFLQLGIGINYKL
jgi:hypothetical protein